MRTVSTAGFGLALVSAASFGTSGSFARSLTDAGWTSGAAVAVRIGIAAAVLAIPALVSMRGRWHLVKPNLGPLALYGLVAVAGVQVAFFYAIQRLSVGVALLLEYLGILLVVAWLWLVRGQRPRRYTIAGAVVSILGLVLMLDLTGVSVDPIGVLFGLGAAVGLGTFFLLSSRSVDALPPLAFASAGMAIGTVAIVVLGWAGAVPLRATFDDVTFASTTMSWLWPVLGLAIVAAALSYVSGIGAARILGARLASFVGLTEVLFAIIVAWIFLDELPAGIQLVGGALIVTGVALVRIDELRLPAEPVPSG